MKKKISTFALATVLGTGALFGASAQPAQAMDKEDMYRVGTYGLGAATAYMLVKGKGTMGLIGAAGTYYAHKKWKDEVEERHDRERDRNRNRRVIRRR